MSTEKNSRKSTLIPKVEPQAKKLIDTLWHKKEAPDKLKPKNIEEASRTSKSSK
jgi:hypothetical protein